MVLETLTDEPLTTSELYERVGYMRLMSAGLIPYRAFRRALAELEAEGLAVSATDEDGATTWRRG